MDLIAAMTRRPADPSKRKKGEPRELAPDAASSSRTAPAVLTWLRDLDDPRKPEIDLVRQLILDVSPDISEIFKWNAPTFRTTEDFVTFNLGAKGKVRLVFHTGAKVKKS